MSGKTRPSGRIHCTICLATMALVLVLAPNRSVADGDEEGRLAAQLAAGEFAPAVNEILTIVDPHDRDHLLRQVVEAQAESGAYGAALHTATRMTDERMRRTGLGAAGGGTQADFDTLIDLITSTIEPASWEDVGGPGAIDGFPTGVFVDPEGVLKQSAVGRRVATPELGRVTDQLAGLRKVSLPRLELALLVRQAKGQAPSPPMKTLAGLQRVEYVMAYPDTGDVVIAGPAASLESLAEMGDGVAHFGVRLEDLAVAMHHAFARGGRFGCAINPRNENLARTHEFLKSTAQRSLHPSERPRWLGRLQALMGRQDIEVFGTDPDTPTARVLVAADYHMKLIGMGLVPGTGGVTSYLESIEPGRGGSLPPLTVLRWWFTPNYNAIEVMGDLFHLRGGGVQVKSENELLGELGQRIHTGQSSPLNRQFADSFTEHFEDLAARYPIYRRLRSIFDLAIIAAILQTEDLPGRVGWVPSLLVEADEYLVPRVAPPVEVDSVVNYRLINQRHIVAGISGGVSVHAAEIMAKAKRVDRYKLRRTYEASQPTDKRDPDERWWWD